MPKLTHQEANKQVLEIIGYKEPVVKAQGSTLASMPSAGVLDVLKQKAMKGASDGRRTDRNGTQTMGGGDSLQLQPPRNRY